jgi:hypothetical protein
VDVVALGADSLQPLDQGCHSLLVAADLNNSAFIGKFKAEHRGPPIAYLAQPLSAERAAASTSSSSKFPFRCYFNATK